MHYLYQLVITKLYTIQQKVLTQAFKQMEFKGGNLLLR